MALNIVSQSNNEYDAFVKYNAKAGRWYVRNDKTDTEIKDPTFVADFENIKTGWFHFAEGQAPDIAYDPDLQTAAAKPSDNHKRGFEFSIFSKNAFGGVAKFGSASALVCNAISSLYEEYEKEAGKNKGKLPVVQVTGAEPVKSKHGTNYQPLFKIAKWVDRPEEMNGKGSFEEEPASNEISDEQFASEF